MSIYMRWVCGCRLSIANQICHCLILFAELINHYKYDREYCDVWDFEQDYFPVFLCGFLHYLWYCVSIYQIIIVKKNYNAHHLKHRID